MTSQLFRAAMIANIAHDNQTDMLGKPYFDHCERVANNVYRWAEGNIYAGLLDDLIAVAYLHDVVEDTDWTLDDLRRLGGFSQAVIDGVDAMTQRTVQDWTDEGLARFDSEGNVLWKREPLEDYWARVKANPLARIVKVHGDIPDNNDPKRKEYLDPSLQAKLTDKYARALAFLGDDDE